MDNFGDLFGGLGDMIGGFLGGDAEADGGMGLAGFLAPENRSGEPAPIVYERYLCGKPQQLHINDR